MKTLLHALTAALLLTAPSHAAGAKRPNILFILADDQAPFDFKFHNPQSTLDSPNIDRLASSGMILDSAHHMGSFTGAVCTPSRHMIMSGRTLWHLPIGPGERNCPPDLEKNTIGAVFNRAGYATMRTCKQGNSYPAANKQFSVVHDATKRGGTGESGSAWHADRVLDYLGDLLATFCDLAGVAPPETNEGTSFKPVLTGEKQTIRDTLYGVYSGGGKPGMRSVKQGDWKLIQYESTATGVRQTQLFNLKENPHELIAEHHNPQATNLAAAPQHAAKIAEMQALLLAGMRRLNDPWRFSNQPDDGLTPPKNHE